VKITNSISTCPNPIKFQSDLIQFQNIQKAVEDLNENPNLKELYPIIGAAIKEIGGLLSDIPIETLENLITKAEKDVIPTHSCPIKDKKCQEQSQGLCNMMCLLPGIKAPG
jgi:hypothetical protein